MAILLTGGTGYIGSHTAVELLNKNYEVIIVDNLSNSSEDVINDIQEITGKRPTLYIVDLLEKDKLRTVFNKHNIQSVIHFAGLKAVGESAQIPLNYYMNNVTTTLILCEVMEEFNVHKLVFSSSATVYGIPDKLPITEEATTTALNPYGRTKLMCEKILLDIANSNEKWKIAMLRYFNPVGAHESGLIGEKPIGIPNNLMPYVTKVAIGELESLNIYGNDYPTSDGTGIRDYIHVSDLARGHISALNHINKIDSVDIFNLGTGQGYSVLEVVNEIEKVTGKNIAYEIKDRRVGDAAKSYADPSKANTILNWEAEKGLSEICEDIWNFVEKSYVKYD